MYDEPIMYDEPKVKPMTILVYLLVFLALVFGLYILYHDSNDVNNDKKTINALSNFNVEHDPNAESDYSRLLAYTPKTKEGEDFKAEKVKQKRNEIYDQNLNKLEAMYKQ